MKQTRRENLVFLGGAASAILTPLGASAGDTVEVEGAVVHEVQMLNKHPDNSRERQVFVPDIVRAKVGDTIKFVTVDKGHNSESSKKGIPAGAEAWRGKINADVEYVIKVEGAYLYNCKPHRTAGMVGLLLVGDVSGNYEEVKKSRFRGKERKRYEDIFARADEILATEAAGSS
ncbi:MAG: pseudoazurin [Rhodobacteraceae bacterium]|nr:pseudoazurin [Paracoccaceae bacterium]